MIWAFGILGGVLLLVALTLFALVDDWSRDLTTNTAATGLDAADPALRPLELDLDPAAAATLVEHAAEDLGNWKLQASRADGAAQQLHFVRHTRLGFRDDVRVTLSPTASGTRIEVASASRIGRGDLGQNPRNIKELLGAVRRLKEQENR